jgi:hypothetical protein
MFEYVRTMLNNEKRKEIENSSSSSNIFYHFTSESIKLSYEYAT